MNKILTFDAPTGAPGDLIAALARRSLGWRAVHPGEVQQWFRDATRTARGGKAKAIAPTQEIAAALANKITILAKAWPLSASDAIVTESSPLMRADRPKNKRIGKALATLRKELPGWLDRYKTPEAIEERNAAKRAFPWLERQLSFVSALRDVLLIIERERIFSEPTKGTLRAQWHYVALYLGQPIIAALQASGIKRAGFGNAAAPAVAILKAALAWLGADISEDAIVKAMRRLPKKGNKSPN